MRLKIKEALARRGKTQKWLAEEIGVTEVTISRYANGSRGDRYNDRIMKMCRALDCEPNDLFGYGKEVIGIWNQFEE